MKTVLLNNTPQEALVALAHYVRFARLDQGMTLEELTERTGTSRSTLIRFEKSGAGSTETLVKICAALGLLDAFVTALAPPEKEMTIAELKKLSTSQLRKRGKRRPHGIS